MMWVCMGNPSCASALPFLTALRGQELCLIRLAPGMQELKAKKAEMARLRIQLQQAENRNIKLAQEAAERERKRREAEEFEAMKLRVLQLEHLVAEKALVDPAAVRLMLLMQMLKYRVLAEKACVNPAALRLVAPSPRVQRHSCLGHTCAG